MKSECSLFSSLPVGEKEMSDPICFRALHAFTFNQQRPGTQKSSTHLLAPHYESEAVTTWRKNPGSPMALQTAGHSPAGSSTWTRVSLGAEHAVLKHSSLLHLLAALQPFPPPHKSRAAFLMVQHRTRILPLIPRNTEVIAARTTQKKCVPQLLLKQVGEKQAPSAGRTTHLLVTLIQ